jgi:hypothetical protein
VTILRKFSVSARLIRVMKEWWMGSNDGSDVSGIQTQGMRLEKLAHISNSTCQADTALQVSISMIPINIFSPLVAPREFGSDQCFAGQSTDNICLFNRLNFFTPGRLEEIKAQARDNSSLD